MRTSPESIADLVLYVGWPEKLTLSRFKTRGGEDPHACLGRALQGADKDLRQQGGQGAWSEANRGEAVDGFREIVGDSDIRESSRTS